MDNLSGRGINLHPLCNPSRIVKRGEEQYTVHYKDGEGAELSIDCGLVMFATGAMSRLHGAKSAHPLRFNSIKNLSITHFIK